MVKRGYTVIKEVEDYKHDLVLSKNGKTFYFELEVKHNYPFTNRDSFRFPTVSFLGRKKKLHDFKKFNYVIICRETKWAITCESEHIYKDEYTEVLDINTSHRQGTDEFYRVPKEFCNFFKIQ